MKKGRINLLVHFSFNRFHLLVLIISLYGFNFVPIGIYLPLPVSGFGQGSSGGLSTSSYEIPDTGLAVNYPQSGWEQRYEFDMPPDTDTIKYITSFDTHDGAVLRLFLYNVGDIAPDAYNDAYYNIINKFSQITYSKAITLGGLLPGGIMSYTTPCSDCTSLQDLQMLESWGKLPDNSGYIDFKFVAKDPDSYANYFLTASTIAGSIHNVYSGGTGGTGGFGTGGTGGFGS